MKERGGLILEYGVHTSDLTLYFMGNVERVFAETQLWEKTRTMAETAQPMQGFYDHRVKEGCGEVRDHRGDRRGHRTGPGTVRLGRNRPDHVQRRRPGEPSDTDIIYAARVRCGFPAAGRVVRSW